MSIPSLSLAIVRSCVYHPYLNPSRSPPLCTGGTRSDAKRSPTIDTLPWAD